MERMVSTTKCGICPLGIALIVGAILVGAIASGCIVVSCLATRQETPLRHEQLERFHRVFHSSEDIAAVQIFWNGRWETIMDRYNKGRLMLEICKLNPGPDQPAKRRDGRLVFISEISKTGKEVTIGDLNFESRQLSPSLRSDTLGPMALEIWRE